MNLVIVLVAVTILSVLIALRMWRKREEERGLAEFWEVNSSIWEKEANMWAKLYHQTKRDTLRDDADWWK